jgi:hypothetical protein
MTETESGERKIPIYVHGQTKPKPVDGYKWVPEFNEWKTDQIIGWRRVEEQQAKERKKGAGQHGGLPSPQKIEKSRENYFPSIEDSLPKGDRD